jgi:hypothetical protein
VEVRECDVEVREHDVEVRECDGEVRERDVEVRECDGEVRERDAEAREVMGKSGRVMGASGCLGLPCQFCNAHIVAAIHLQATQDHCQAE